MTGHLAVEDTLPPITNLLQQSPQHSLLQYNRTNLKMSKQAPIDITQSAIRKKIVKSTDLKRRLFEVGLNLSPSSNSPLFNTIASPKRNMLTKHPLSSKKETQPHLLKFQPSNSPKMAKTSKDFQIRKSPKQFFPASPSPKNNQSATLSSFYRPDSIRGDTRELKSKLLQFREKQQQLDLCVQEKEMPESKLDEYVSLVLRGVDHIDEFLYLVRGSEENIYELELVDFQLIRQHQGENGFQYYTVSKKGFCQYIGGKPHAFLDISQWFQEKSLYMKIKALKFFYRFRRWKTLQMWRRTITKQRREAISHSLIEKLFILQPTTRITLLELRKLTLEMERSVLIIAKNEGTYTLESFKHCQERARREASLAVEEYSRESRAVVRKCFENKLAELRENMKKKAGEEKSAAQHSTTGSQSPKESAFQALGFPSKMTYEHRSKLRKQAGRFLRFSYLVDSIHLSCLAGLYSGQVSAFISRLEQYQLGEEVKLRPTIEQGKDEAQRERMFILQLQCNFRDIPQRLICQCQEKQEWNPSKDIRLKNQERGIRYWVPRLCEFWLNLQPNLDEVLDQLGFLIREGLGSLKCFEKWARHREMQKYVSILEEWDDLVSENWEISQNDNLDPLLLLDSLDPALSKLKLILKTTENRLIDTIRATLTELLNAYWQYSQLSLLKLQSQDLANPAESFENFLMYTSKLLERVTNQLPHRIELGVISVQITRIKTTLGQKFAGILESLKGKLPELVEERTNILNNWLTLFGARLREEILNIDDFVKIVEVIKEIEKEFGQKREECNELAQLYQTMQQFRMDTRRRKDFQTVTLKLKDQLEQLLITAQQNIERKTDLYTKEVLKYHLPTLVRDINKALENVEQPRFLKIDSYRAGILEDLKFLQNRESQLIQQRTKCENYMNALKIQGQTVGELDELSKQISSRVELWKTLNEWEILQKEYQTQSAKMLPLSLLIQLVEEYKTNIQRLEEILPPNQILTFLKQSIKEYHVYLPMLNGFSETLSETHWTQIYEVLPEKYTLDLKKRDFTLQEFLKSNIGAYSRQIQSIFQKCRVQAKLQREYQAMQDSWMNLIAKIKVQGKFMVITNGDNLRDELDKVLFDLTTLLSNPHAQSLKQYSITYDSLFAAQDSFENWLKVQDKIVEVEKNCRLLDIKKLPDYNFFENAERLYKQITKPMSNKGAETGVRIGKLLVAGIEEKLGEIELNLKKVEDNIKGILRDHRRIFPSFYLFTDAELLRLITEQSHQSIQWAAKALIPSISRLQFQNQRISSIISIDEDRFIKNPISISSEIQQILLQITETTSELNRRALRSCRYKAVENNLSSLVEQYNIQHLLAISRVDFSHYTTISIDNQQDTPDSLAQFRKVMRKDTAEDIKNRQHKINQMENHTQDILSTMSSTKVNSTNYLQKYDTLLLQQLLYQEILDYLIKKNIQRAEEYAWASQLKFFWEDTQTDEPNITIKQMHLSLKYGNEFIGSKTKVILQNQVEALLGLKYNDCVVYNGNKYNVQRLINAIGYKMWTSTCTELTTQHNLKRFLIGCYFADFIPFFNRADQLSHTILDKLPSQTWIDEFKTTHLKRNSPYIKEIQRNHSIFLNVRDSITGWQSLQGKMRVVHYMFPKKEFLKCNMKLRGMFSEERTNLLLRIFEAVWFLEEKSKMQGVSLEQFLDLLLLDNQEIDEHHLFEKVLKYLKPKITIETHNAMTKHIQSLALLPFNQRKMYENKNKIDLVFECLRQRKVIILTGKGFSKKYFVKKEAERLKIKFIELFGENLSKSQLFGFNSENQSIKEEVLFEKYLEDCSDQIILYFEGVNPDILLSLENLLYANNRLAELLFKSSTKIILDIPSQQKFITPRELTSFPIIHLETSREYTNCIINQWLNQVKQQEKKRSLSRIIFETIVPTLQSLTVKDDIVLEQRIVVFLNFLSSLGQFKNLLEACIYILVTMYRGWEEEQLKLEYMVKKHLGEEKLSEDTKIINLFYNQSLTQEKLITQKEYLKIWLQENTNFNDQTNILTPSLLHQLIISQRIHDNTNHPILLEGSGNSGKTTLLHMYRKMHHENSFYMHVTPAQGSQWQQKLTSSLQRHGLDVLGARINYQQSIIMIEDLHLADKKSLEPLKLMLFYSKCRINSKDFNLRNVKFMLSAQKNPECLEKKCLKLYLDFNKQQLQSIFGDYLKKYIEKQWDLSQLLIQKIANNSIQLCKKIVGEDNEQLKESFSVLRRILTGFGKLKIKQGLPIQKEIQKFWAFALVESLKSYDRQNQLESQLRRLDLASYNPTLLSYTHLTCKPTERKSQFLKDPKRLYNLLNEKIEKYNQSDTKRYGQSFEFLNFDCILQKIATISHSILLDSDHLLVGRKGTGKESLVKLCSFFNGLFYKNIKGNIKNTIIQLIDGSLSSPHLLYKSISNEEDHNHLRQYYYCDFESEVLSHGESKPKVGPRLEKQKSVHAKSLHKNAINTDNFIIPKAKLTYQEVISYKKSFRLVASLNNPDDLKRISAEVRSKLHVDFIEEVPTASVVQYNQKLLTVDSITCTKDAQIVLSQIFEFSRQKLGLSLRANDDCVRLFSSFLANLVNEMVLEEERYSKVLDLLRKLKNCYTIINDEVSKLHSKLKELSQNSEHSRQIKMQIQSELREKSTAQSISQKLTEILSWLEPLYKLRLNSIKKNLDNRDNLQITFAITSSYFIYLSNISYQKRRDFFVQWYKNIPMLQQLKPIQSFLSLFLLYQEQFNAEPVDHLPQFYENMSIIFHSAKPIAIKDYNSRGKSWLQKNCSFFYLREDQKDFLELMKDYLGKSSNILIQVVQQETLSKITSSLIGTLLFLPESVNTINLKGQEVDIHQEAKVYLLVKEGLIIPKEIQQEFTVVLFDDSPILAKTAIMHEYYSYTQREHHISKLDYHRKIRSLKLDCQNAIGQIADSIYEQLCGNDLPPQEKLLIERLNKITDKLMVRAQNQFTKIKEKQELVHDFQQKYQKADSKICIEPAEEFYQIASRIKDVLQLMGKKQMHYYCPTYAQFFSTLKISLSKGLISTIPSLILAALRQWGAIYQPQHYNLYAFLLLIVAQGKQISQFLNLLNEDGIRSTQFLKLIGKENQIIQKQGDLYEIISQTLTNMFKEEDFKSIGPMLSANDTLDLPLVWLAEEGHVNCNDAIKIVRIKTTLQPSQLKQRLIVNHPKIFEPTEEDSLESLLKKNPHEEIQVIIYSKQSLKQAEKIIRQWSLVQKSVIFLYDTGKDYQKNSKHHYWNIDYSNEQRIFSKVIDYYKSLKETDKQEVKEESINQSQSMNFTGTASLSFTGTASLSHGLHIDHSQEPINDNYVKLLEKFINCIKWKYESLSLPVPIINKKQLQIARKNIDSIQNPMVLSEKITFMLQTIESVLHPPSIEITLYIKSLEAKLAKICTEIFTEEQFFKEAECSLSEGNQFVQNKIDPEKSMLELELGWLIKTRRFFGLTNEELLTNYIKEIEECIASCLIYNEAPKVTRGSKRQLNIKNRRESSVNKKAGRESLSMSKRTLMNKQKLGKIINSPLASLYLLKETEYFQHILYKIHKDLQRSKSDLQNIDQRNVSQKTLNILLSIMKKQAIPSWKIFLSEIGCANTSLNLSIRNIISRRNQIYTYYNKFSISQTCELQFKFIRHPAEFLRAYFKSELTSQDTFMLTTCLLPQEAERGDYLRVNGLWGLGWRLTPEGIIENMGENKPFQNTGCFIVKKSITGMTVNVIDLLAGPENPQLLMKLYAVSKKAQTNIALKLYLKND